jgi:hypothetical protein
LNSQMQVQLAAHNKKKKEEMYDPGLNTELMNTCCLLLHVDSAWLCNLAILSNDTYSAAQHVPRPSLKRLLIVI